jgi:hypothetical protein
VHPEHKRLHVEHVTGETVLAEPALELAGEGNVPFVSRDGVLVCDSRAAELALDGLVHDGLNDRTLEGRECEVEK